ncbi:MAG: NADH-quinone oxidoreductase subunit L [Candidatus Omnitrophica bacterium]|nr:NADH-quinone oxidoreductase subunit L [Candidatus Omnitrophota bacterium]
MNSTLLNSVLFVVLFPVFGSLFVGIAGKWLKKPLAGIIASCSVGLSFVISVFTFFSLIKLPPDLRFFDKVFFQWVPVGHFLVNFGFYVDPLSLLMIMVVSSVSFVIHLYSIGYMKDEEHFSRYFSYLNLFVASMLLLVLADNFLLLFMGWEGVGLCSYLLIGFWFHKKSAADAGRKAFIINRIGDFGFLLGILLIYHTFKSLNYNVVFSNAPLILSHGSGIATAITLLLFMGAVGKSAQLPLYVWLPDAMEGPTPVSALIHAATMVTAGVYMVARTHVLYQLSPVSMGVVAFVGIITAFYSASIGMVQFDIKRILAYSTISQLGYMFLGVGVAAYSAGIFHLMSHAFFKALLFLCAGSIMHASAGETDLRKLSGLRKYLPVTFWTMVIGALSLSGFPGTAGFFSKDDILAHAYVTPYYGKFLWGLGIITAALTSFYIFRMIFIVFWGDKQKESHPHESPKIMTFPLIILALLAIIGGYVGLPESNLIHRFLSPVFLGTAVLSSNVELKTIMVSLVFSLGGIATAWYFYLVNPSLPESMKKKAAGLYKLLLNKYFVDEIYERIFVLPGRKLSSFFADVFDAKYIDGAVNETGKWIKTNSEQWRKIHTGYLRNYALIILIGGILLLGFLMTKIH